MQEEEERNKLRREAAAQNTTQKGEERDEAKVHAREVLTAVENHEADLEPHKFDPQLLCEERYREIESLSIDCLSLRVSALCRLEEKFRSIAMVGMHWQ